MLPLLILIQTPAQVGTVAFSFPRSSDRVVAAITLFALMAPGFRSRKHAPPTVESVRPDSVRALLRLQRDPAARFSLAVAGEGALALEDGTEGHLLVHYAGGNGSVTIGGGWLGAGRRRYIWLPLRSSLAWNAPASNTQAANAPLATALTGDEISRLAADLHLGLDQLGERHVLEQFFEPAMIPEKERRAVLDSYAAFMQAHGWEVTYDSTLSRRSLKRTAAAESPQRWSTADREALTRLEALVEEMLKGVRSSSRILFQTK